MGLKVNRELCIGAGHCVQVAPDLFDQDESDGLVVQLVENPGTDLQGALREAASLCPSGALGIDS
ncbi:ferredoxin [Kribbella sp. NPDC023972]|uniref:ferredoxin n=1 Tax=Kribbella sp. NPDC023972 TaxID=3154795 RepID=UPI0033C83B1D